MHCITPSDLAYVKYPKFVSTSYGKIFPPMSSLKEALARVSRVVRNTELLRQHKNPSILLPTDPVPAKHSMEPPRPRIPKQQFNDIRPYLSGFLRKRFQKFLEPLNMPQLKIFDDNIPPYDEARAEHNLASKRSTERLEIFANFLGERPAFDKMLALLVELTPADLMDKETIENPVSLAHILQREDELFLASRYDSVPGFHFTEVPPIPSPLTKESFQRYIYQLTHLKMLYRNLSSLTSGIIPEILLYTHKLTNTQFKAVRSTETYNYLIKYFGFDKFQASFARELLLVMVKDGHTPNINTINQLLKICRIHAKRRSLVSTFKVVTNYLNLAKTLELRLNLATWNRVYDCIENIFLKEAFLNKMLAVCLPVLDNMCLQILNDFGRTTKDTNEVIAFVELDLHRVHWRQNPRIVDKIIYHQIIHMSLNEDLGVVFEKLLREMSTDALTLKAITNGIDANPNFSHKPYLLLSMYTQFSPGTDVVPPETYARAIQLFGENIDNYDIFRVNFFVRGIIHHDATKMLNLPVEIIQYEELPRHNDEKRRKYAYKVHKALFPENYRIIKRIAQKQLDVLEAKVIHAKKQNPLNKHTKFPWDSLSGKEEEEWQSKIEMIKAQEKFWENTPEKALGLGLVSSDSSPTPENVIHGYVRYNRIQRRVSSQLSTIQKLEKGFDQYLEEEMRERNVIDERSEQEA